MSFHFIKYDAQYLNSLQGMIGLMNLRCMWQTIQQLYKPSPNWPDNGDRLIDSLCLLIVSVFYLMMVITIMHDFLLIILFMINKYISDAKTFKNIILIYLFYGIVHIHIIICFILKVFIYLKNPICVFVKTV